MTLTHVKNTDWADASTDKAEHNGLSDFGLQTIAEMNRLGIIVDVSHISDKALCDVLAASKAPVLASHSSCYALCATPRNLTDDLIRALTGDKIGKSVAFDVLRGLERLTLSLTPQERKRAA